MRNLTINRQSNRGFVLVTSLIFLMVLSVLATMAMRGSLFGERISSNERDMYLAREAAELALRDAERDILGQRIDGSLCAVVGSSTCGGNLRISGTRTPSTDQIKNFQMPSTGLADTVSSASRPSNVTTTNIGVYSTDAADACGKSLWLAADWDTATPTNKCTDGSSIVRTVVYGEFTGAPNIFGASARLPRYLIEGFSPDQLFKTPSSRMIYRITAVGFGRTSKDDNTLTSVTLQSVFSP